MKEHIALFLTHFDDYLDVCLGLNMKDNLDSIRKMKRELKSNSSGISNEEYHKKEANIFYEYLKLVGAVS